eukprot:534953-Pelagomonas_calceolata.AAC.3
MSSQAIGTPWSVAVELLTLVNGLNKVSSFFEKAEPLALLLLLRQRAESVHAGQAATFKRGPGIQRP